MAFWRVRQAGAFDVVFVQKGLISTSLKGLERALLRRSKKIIYDFDDDVLGQLIVTFRSSFLRSRQDMGQTLKLAGAAQTVIAGNDYLSRKALEYNRSTVLLPTPVDTDRFAPSTETPAGKTVVLGWIGMEIGLGYLRRLGPVLENLARRYPVCLKVISRCSGAEKFEIPGIATRFVPWSYESEVREMQEFDIGIMPVEEDEWGPGKCGLKLLQYMAMGIASTASRVGANCEIVDEGQDAFLAASAEEWEQKLSALIESPELRKKMGSAARRKAVEKYSLKALAPKFIRIVKGEGEGEGRRWKVEEEKNKHSLRITYILPQMDIGGAETHVVRLAEGLRRKGHDARILCVFEEGRLAPWIHEKKMPLTALRAPRWGLGLIAKIRGWLLQNPADIVHTYLFGLHFFAGLPAKQAGVPRVLSSRRDVELSQPAKVLWLEKAGNFFCDRVTACSEAVRQWTLGRENLKSEKITTLYNGVDLAEFVPGAGRADVRREFGIPQDASVIGTVANFSPKKGYAYLIEAAAQVLAARPESYFLFAGAGPLQAEMEKRAALVAGGDRILFTGARRDIARILAAMDIFVFVSLWEGLPNVVLEAMAMALAVVSTPAGGVPEIITDGLQGRLVPFRDPAAAAGVILELLEHPGLRQELGRAARQKIEMDFTLERMIDEYERFYQDLLTP